ncbi:TetR/AcrR family transcriptional regulator [Jiangella gansuensis]|uniref:TetR/AcrR family transcriptional regulator n=1 Tax=Jiangella gansuensis TaxID=281473 RepID=UPI000479BEBD|nr:TetR/AcrR family transcriptional regulator [Jiangella gansuensis]
MPEWVPVPGSAKARLIEAALHEFEQAGYAAVAVTDLAAKAGVTTGSLYHHFGSKLGLYTVVRDDVEKRITDRMEGAAAAVGGTGRTAVRAAVLVAFDAAARFGTCRLLGETTAADRPDPIRLTLEALLPDDAGTAAVVLAAAWRAALLETAGGAPAAAGRRALEFLLSG